MIYNYVISAPTLLATADTTKELLAAPDTGIRVLVKAIHWSVRTSAAQKVQVGKSTGTVAQQFLELPASFTGVGTRAFEGSGFLMPVATAVSAVPDAAGPGIIFIIEYAMVDDN